MYYVFCSISIVLLFLYAVRTVSFGAWIVIFPFFISSFIAIISSLYIESGIYIFEQGIISYKTGATARLIITFFIFWGVFHLVNHLYRYSWKRNWRVQSGMAYPRAALFMAVSLLIIMLVNISISDTPPLFKAGYISRFGYIENTTLWPYISMFGVVATTIPLLSGFAFEYFRNSEKRLFAAISVAVILGYTIYIVIIGHKFGGIVYGVFFFLLPYVIRYVHRYGVSKVLRKAIVPAIGLGSIVFSFIYYHYSTYSLAENYGGPLDFIAYRIFGLQAHVWWGIDQFVFINGKDMFLNSEGLASSMPTMMHIVGKPGIDTAIDRGVNFTFGFPASAFLFFGIYAGFIIVAVISALTAVLIRDIIINISRYDLIGYFLSAYLLVWVFNILSLGSFETFFKLKFIFVIMGIIIYKVFRQINKMNRQKRFVL